MWFQIRIWGSGFVLNWTLWCLKSWHEVISEEPCVSLFVVRDDWPRGDKSRVYPRDAHRVTTPLEGALKNGTWFCYICCWCWESKLRHSSCDSWSGCVSESQLYIRGAQHVASPVCRRVSWPSGRNSELQGVTLWMKARWGSQIIAGSDVRHLIIHSMSHTVAAVVRDTSSTPWKHFSHFLRQSTGCSMNTLFVVCGLVWIFQGPRCPVSGPPQPHRAPVCPCLSSRYVSGTETFWKFVRTQPVVNFHSQLQLPIFFSYLLSHQCITNEGSYSHNLIFIIIFTSWLVIRVQNIDLSSIEPN